MRFYDNADTLAEEQVQFSKDLVDYSRGQIDPTKFKAIRVAHGVYEQRQDHTYMIRIRCAAGGITPTQLKQVAKLGELYGSGEVHFTTRQEVQIHDVTLDNIMAALHGLREVGLSSRGGGGNTIRNILTSSDSGIHPDEVFDVDPYAIALTTRMIHEPDSWNLPRKFKIAFSTGPSDTAFTQATCLGFMAKMKQDQKGFEVYCSGGMGAKPMVGHLLLDWIPDTQVYHVTRAIKTMFNNHGNRRNRNQNRIKFLWKKIGRETFVSLFEEEYNKIKDNAALDLLLPTIKNEAKSTDWAVETQSGIPFEKWKKRYVMNQKQSGLASILLPLKLGDLCYADANALCDFLTHFGENTIRCERAQNIRLRNIPISHLGNAYTLIMSLDSLSGQNAFIGKMMNCTGAQTCKLGICLPRGLSKAIQQRLMDSQLDLDQIPDFRLNMSGCPNTCGMHHIANLGFFGKVGRNKGALYPAYNVLAGAKVGFGKTEYAQKVSDIAAHFIPDFTHDFLEDYIAKKQKYSHYNDYLDKEGTAKIQQLCEQYKVVPEYDDDPKCYTDFGAKRRLSLEQLGTAECSAGMFDMIDVDKKQIKTIRKALPDVTQSDKPEVLYKLLFHTSRMLLVARGLDAKTDEQVFALFDKHFIQTELIPLNYSGLVKQVTVTSALCEHEADICALSDSVVGLYNQLGDSLTLPNPHKEAAPTVASDQLTDFRNVPCPMNFVKTKIALDPLKKGDYLTILLDDGQPIDNVPASIEGEGHRIVKKEQVGSHWVVVIEKK